MCRYFQPISAILHLSWGKFLELVCLFLYIPNRNLQIFNHFAGPHLTCLHLHFSKCRHQVNKFLWNYLIPAHRSLEFHPYIVDFLTIKGKDEEKKKEYLKRSCWVLWINDCMSQNQSAEIDPACKKTKAQADAVWQVRRQFSHTSYCTVTHSDLLHMH